MKGEPRRALGLELGGTRNDRTALAVLDYFPSTQRLILTDVEAVPAGQGEQSADEVLLERITTARTAAGKYQGLAVHGPVSLPPYFRGAPTGRKLPMPFKAKHPEVIWMTRAWKNLKPRPKPFLPYLQRPEEIWLRYLTPEKFNVPDGMGANLAPLAARFQFLAPHLKGPVHEVYPRATLTRMVGALGLSKNIFRLYSDLEKGVIFREDFLTALQRKLPRIFLYEKDVESMILHINCFHAFLAALTEQLFHAGQTEPRPLRYPKSAGWIHIPRPDPAWDGPTWR